MNDLIRPAMYDSWHEIVPLDSVDALGALSPADIVGPVCESGDTFATDRPLPALRPGAGVAFLDCGAYGSVMSSTYNARPLAAQVLVAGHEWAVIRPRQTLSSLWEAETMPGFLKA
jgi:diaminopimelate decarboxylase